MFQVTIGTEALYSVPFHTHHGKLAAPISDAETNRDFALGYHDASMQSRKVAGQPFHDISDR